MHCTAQEGFGVGPPSKKKRRLTAGGGAAKPADALSFAQVLRGKRRGEACRWFFELLVLKSKNYVELEQAAPYGNIHIRPQPKLLA